ncbi:hypothetical protein EJB05_12421, partial [Eragrostis curvula]
PAEVLTPLAVENIGYACGGSFQCNIKGLTFNCKVLLLCLEQMERSAATRTRALEAVAEPNDEPVEQQCNHFSISKSKKSITTCAQLQCRSFDYGVAQVAWIK